MKKFLKEVCGVLTILSFIWALGAVGAASEFKITIGACLVYVVLRLALAAFFLGLTEVLDR